MNITVIGASSGVGLETVKRALQRGHNVTALSRSGIDLPENQHLISIKGDATNKGDLGKAFLETDAVIVTLGSAAGRKPVTVFSDFAKVLVDLHHDHKFQFPVIVLTGYGAGDRGQYPISLLLRIAFNSFLRNAYADKNRMEKLITGSSLKWIIVRPGQLTNASLPEKYTVVTKLNKRTPVSSISRADLADYMVKQAENPTHIWMFSTFVGS